MYLDFRDDCLCFRREWMNEFVEILRQNETFQKVLQDAKAERPMVPPYNHNPDNTEEWKALSNMQRGFDLCLSRFGEEIE